MAHQADYSISLMCRVLGVSRSGFYAWRTRPPSARAQADTVLGEQITRLHAHSRGTYGRPRIHASLRTEGTHASGKRIARLMRLAGLVGVSRRKQPRAAERKETPPAPDLVHRQFTASGPNKLWVAEIA
jgi:putative transposase